MSNGSLWIVSAPSGAGKTSLVRALVQSRDDVTVAVSHTTRPMRSEETDGTNYYFVDEARFTSMIDEGGFLEWARVFDNLYGTSRAEVDRVLAGGQHLVLEIDWQGAAQVREIVSEVRSIFIVPPSLTTLRSRLNARGQDDADVVEKRLAAAIEEISHYGEFDYLVVNDDFDTALADMQRIVSGDATDLAVNNLKNDRSDLLNQLLGAF